MTTRHLELLGKKVTDTVTGFKGVITSISFDLYGCIQCVVTPPVNDAGKKEDGHWFDITRLDITGKKPVMNPPDFEQGYIAEGKKGEAIKSLPPNI